MKTIVFLLLFGFLAWGLPAADKAPAATNAEWDFVSFTFVPGVPPTAAVLNVYGVKVGIPFAFGDDALVSGAELSIFGGMTVRIYGLQGAFLFNTTRDIDGLQASLCTNIAESVKGIQFGCVNIAKDSSFQIGLVNIIKDSPVKFFPFINVRF